MDATVPSASVASAQASSSDFLGSVSGLPSEVTVSGVSVSDSGEDGSTDPEEPETPEGPEAPDTGSGVCVEGVGAGSPEDPYNHCVTWTPGVGNEPSRQITLRLGDTLTFNWEGDNNVYIMASEEAMNNCNFIGATLLSNTAGEALTVSTLPAYYSRSSCTSGQTLKVLQQTNPDGGSGGDSGSGVDGGSGGEGGSGGNGGVIDYNPCYGRKCGMVCNNCQLGEHCEDQLHRCNAVGQCVAEAFSCDNTPATTTRHPLMPVMCAQQSQATCYGIAR